MAEGVSGSGSGSLFTHYPKPFCHPERSEGTGAVAPEKKRQSSHYPFPGTSPRFLRCAQDDKPKAHKYAQRMLGGIAAEHFPHAAAFRPADGGTG